MHRSFKMTRGSHACKLTRPQSTHTIFDAFSPFLIHMLNTTFPWYVRCCNSIMPETEISCVSFILPFLQFCLSFSCKVSGNRPPSAPSFQQLFRLLIVCVFACLLVSYRLLNLLVKDSCLLEFTYKRLFVRHSLLNCADSIRQKI